MGIPIIPLSGEEKELVAGLLQDHLPKLEAAMQDTSLSEDEVQKARYSHYCVKNYLNAEEDENNVVALKPNMLQALIYNIRMALHNRCEAMKVLLQDESLPMDERIEVATYAASLIPLTRTFSDPTLPGTITTKKAD